MGVIWAFTETVTGRPGRGDDHRAAGGASGVAVTGQPSGIVSHHWHHHWAPTRMRSFGCQQYEISAVFSR